MKKTLFLTLCFSSLLALGQTNILWLNDLNVKKIESGWSTSAANKSIDGNPLTVGGKKYDKGVGTHSVSKVLINLFGKATSFKASVGIDDEIKGTSNFAEFYVICDKKIAFKSGKMKKGDLPKIINVNLSGVQKMALLVADGGDGIDYDHADWLEAHIEYAGQIPQIADAPKIAPYILTPKVSDSPRINGARIIGGSPNKPFLFTVPVTGKRPITYSATTLPAGLKIDPNSGIISGTVTTEGTYKVKLTAKNTLGENSKMLKIVIGQGKLSLTPPMGWNSWNCWGLSVSQDKVKASADAMVNSGLINHGWSYINIDDGWEAPKRADDGEILPNEKFPDMKGLCDYVHNKGLKIGIYSSPGTLTCGGYLGSLDHEFQDATTYAKWGIDYLKYDWCSYGNEFDKTDKSHAEYKKPYITINKALVDQPRDIVLSLCQYGMDNVWEWGAEVGQLWRTTGDISDSWQSMSSIGFSQYHNTKYAKPGNWNDPDMLVVGKVGWGPSLHPCGLTPDEQYTHISLWSLLASPLLIGGDMSQIDKFTLSLLTNDEVIAVNQDPLGKQAARIKKINNKEIWVKDLEDGSKAVGFFNLGDEGNVVDLFDWDGSQKPVTQSVSVSWNDLNISGKQVVRNLWTQKNITTAVGSFTAKVPYHGVVLVKISPAKK